MTGSKQLENIRNALVVTARSLGYTYKTIRGNNGYHIGFTEQVKVIEIGVDQPLQDQVITLAHELGHAYDIRDNPLEISELALLFLGAEEYTNSSLYYRREVSAWEYGEKLLKHFRSFTVVKNRFHAMRDRDLFLYRQKKIRSAR